MRHVVALLVLAGCSDYEIYKQESADIFYQLDASEVDILLVVDNSCSMEPYQQELAENFDNFLTYFIEGNVDYQIGVVTTSIRDEFYIGNGCESEVAAMEPGGHLVDGQIITPETADADSIFNEIVNVGTCGDGSEMGLEAARMALEYAQDGTANSGFLRDEAFLSVIFVSDEQDVSPDPVNDYIMIFVQPRPMAASAPSSSMAQARRKRAIRTPKTMTTCWGLILFPFMTRVRLVACAARVRIWPRADSHSRNSCETLFP